MISNKIEQAYRSAVYTRADATKAIFYFSSEDFEGLTPLTYMDVIASDENLAEIIDREMQSTRALRYVNTLLDDRERQIILLRYGLTGKEPLTQREIALQLGISRSYVSRLEKSALEKLRKAFGE